MKSLVVILVLKLVEPIGKKFDKKKPVKEDLTQIDELINPNINLPFGGDRITHNHGGAGRRSWWSCQLVSEPGCNGFCQQKEEEEEEEEEKKKQEEEKKNNPKQPMRA